MKTLLKTLTATTFTIFGIFAIVGAIQDSKTTDLSFMQFEQIDNSDLQMIRTRYVAADPTISSEGLIDNIRPVKVPMIGNKNKVNGQWRLFEKVLTNGQREKTNDIVELEFLDDGIVKLVFAGEVEGEKWFIGEDLTEGNTLKLITNIHNTFVTEKQEQDFFSYGSPSNEVLTLYLEKVKAKKLITRTISAPTPEVSESSKTILDESKPLGFKHLPNGVYVLEKAEINNNDVTEKYEMSGSFELIGNQLSLNDLTSNDYLDEEIVEGLKFVGGLIVNGGRIDRIEKMIIATTSKKKIVLRYPQAAGDALQFAYLTFVLEEDNGEINDEYEKLLATEALNNDEEVYEDFQEEDKLENEDKFDDGPMTEEEQDLRMGRRTVQAFDFSQQ